MELTFLFEKRFENKRVYNLNQGYWKRRLQAKLKIKLTKESEVFKNIDARGRKIYDSNPIFTFLSSNKSRAVRIIQDDINLMNLNEFNSIKECDLISAWIDNIWIGEREIPELVIALTLTKHTANKALELMMMWLNNELNEEKISSIIKTPPNAKRPRH